MMTQRLLKVAGLDPSLRNWGISIGSYEMDSKQLRIDQLGLIQTESKKQKQVRQNSQDIEAAALLYRGTLTALKDIDAVFVEVPHGSQSAASMKGYGICIGVLGALRANGVAFFELSELEVKMASVGNRKATKEDMIAWATGKHPEALWLRHTQNQFKDGTGFKKGDLMGANEHLADATAAIYAGIASNQFQQILPLLAASLRKEHHASHLETI